ncbi:SDR family NAD(P)-dependent oxidoreductase, partial [Nonomuraea sp. NPDC059022]|uniref:SDR family NAD(P)-dependent oxidoreductase n=1 Tax=Nonomuraea sp. NPDC059022 TaxID=3346705 RepID=UPI003689B206
MSAELVAVVTGAARGVGRGIALVLGEAGATVYVTDRESRAHRHSDLPGTVEDTAGQVNDRGGGAAAAPRGAPPPHTPPGAGAGGGRGRAGGRARAL